jgi:hypothetical protein
LRFHNGIGYSFDLENMDFATAADSGSELLIGDEVVRPDLDRDALDAAEMMYADFLHDDMMQESGGEWSHFMDDMAFESEAAEMPFFDSSDNMFDDSCASYEAYVEAYQDSDVTDSMLSHSDFHLLEAELETLVALEQEFGYLLTDQMARKDQLIERLFIDPETLLDNDLPDYPDFDEPPFWEN